MGQTSATWLGGSADWFDPAKWSSDPVVPNGDFSVLLPDSGGPSTITLANSITLSSLTLSGPDVRLTPSAGTMTVNGTLDLQAGHFIAMNNFVLRNAFLQSTGGSFGVVSSAASIPTFDNVNVGMEIGIASGQAMRVRNGLTLDSGTFRLIGGGTNAQLFMEGTQWLGGDGVIVFDGTSSRNIVNITSGPVTLGSGVVLQTGLRGGTVSIASSLINQGLISSRTIFNTLHVGGASFLNLGTLEALDGGVLSLGGTWKNQGTITATNSTVNFGGSFALADVGTLILNNGTASISGVLNNASTTLVQDGVAKNWQLAGGTINGGTITARTGFPFRASAGTSTLSGVTIDGLFELSGEARMRLINGLTLNDGTLVIRGAQLISSGTQTIGGSGTINLVYNGGSSISWLIESGLTTLGPEVQFVTSGNGEVIRIPGGLINQGLISSRSPSQKLTLDATGSFLNLARLEAINGGTLAIRGNWANNGTITLLNSTLDLGGTMTMGSIGTLLGNGSTINLTGTLNASSTFNLSGGAWFLRKEARINGGTLVGVGSPPVTVIGPATFNGVSLARNVTIGGDSTATFAGTWTNHATLQSSGQLTIGGAWTNLGTILLGGGTVDLSGTWSSAGLLSANNATLDLRGSFDIASFTPSNSTVTIRGNWNNQGRTIDLVGGTTWTLQGGAIKGGNIVSSGTALISRGATLDSVTLQAPLFHESGNLNLSGNWSNQGTITQTGGGVIFGGTFDQAQIGTFIRNAGSVIFAGTYNGGGTTLDLDQRGWTLYVMNSTINDGTVSGSEKNTLSLSSTSVLLNGVTLAVPTTVSSFSRIVAQNGLRVNGSFQLGATSTLSFPGSQSLDGQGTIQMIATSFMGPTESGILTVGPEISFVAGGAGGAILGSTGNTVVHQGTIQVQDAGNLITAGTFQNSGVVDVRSGGRLSVSGALANYSGGTLTGGRWAVHSNSGITGIPAILTNNASVLLDGPGSTFTAMNRIQSNLGSFAIDHGRTFTTDGSLSNSGFLGVRTNSTLYVSGTLTNTGSIDLLGTIVVDYGPGDAESTVFQQLASQINTSIFTLLITPAKAIGSADNVDLELAEFRGSAIDLTTVLLALTFAGDANLDGATDLSDFDRFLSGFSPADTAALWIHGDFDYSGIVDLLDFESYLHGYYASGGSSAAIAAAVQAAPVSDSDLQTMLLLVSTVPEPGAAAMLVLLLVLPRRARARQ